jgi:hypothetical protein
MHDLRSTELSKNRFTDATGRSDFPGSGCHAGRLTVFAVIVLTSGESYLNREIVAVNTLAAKNR